MTKSVKTKIVAILMAVVCLFSAFVVMAGAVNPYQPGVYEVTAKNGVYVFAAPSGASDHFAIIRKGVQLDVMKVAGDWGLINTGAIYGWIFLPYCEEFTMPGTYADGYYTVTAAKAYVYKVASAYGQKIVALKKGTTVFVTALGGDWGAVNFTSGGRRIQGFVYLRQFAFNDPIPVYDTGLYVANRAVNAYRQPSVNALKYGTLVKGTQFTVNAVSNDWGRITVNYRGNLIQAWVYLPYAAKVVWNPIT
jgi:hypothetical protein